MTTHHPAPTTIRVQLRFFAAVRELLGRGRDAREVPAGTTADDLFALLAGDEPRLAALRGTTMLMVNQEYAAANRPLADGDELALIPPVSGGGDEDPNRRFRVTEEALDPRAVEALVADPAAGAVVTFTGSVRDHARGRAVTALEYEAYAPAAEIQLARIAAEIAERWGIARVAVHHRVGLLPVGEASVVIAVASAHRGEAFAACEYAIVRLKEIVPIWKKEFYSDGAVWIGSEADYRRDRETGATADASGALGVDAPT